LNLLCAMIVREFDITPWVLTLTSVGLFLGAAWVGTREPSRVYGDKSLSLAGK
jgi:hypothetical protein